MSRNTPQGKMIDEIITEYMGGSHRSVDDHAKLRQGSDRHEGFAVGKYLQPAPMIFTRHGHSAWLGDMYRGNSAFLILSGPSFANVDQSKLLQPGILTMGVNNSVRTFRPNMWCIVDNPQNFMMSTWLDPTIMKFIPFCHTEKKIFDNEKWKEANIKVGDCPNTFFYRRNEQFNHEQYLFEDTINWGCHGKATCSVGHSGSRSVMLAAVRLCFILGIRNLYLVGADFKMEYGKPNYHFDQDRTKGSVNGNNKTYGALNARFTALRPIFEKYEYKIYNTVKGSGLTAFDYVPFDEAIDRALVGFPDVNNERTNGMYERQAKLKEEEKRKEAEKKAQKAQLQKAQLQKIQQMKPQVRKYPTLDLFMQAKGCTNG
jgi:hypothetical protein